MANLHILRRSEDYLWTVTGTDLPGDVVLQREDTLLAMTRVSLM